jgi:hypothetical protein
VRSAHFDNFLRYIHHSNIWVSVVSKKKHSLIDELFGGSLFGETKSFPETGYSISMVQTPEGTKVKAKAGKNTDISAFKKQLQQKYPNAKIEIEGGSAKPLIREISTKTLKRESEEDNKTNS